MNRVFLEKSVVRLIVLLCFFFCLQKSVAGVALYGGERAFKKEKFARAVSLLEKAEALDGHNPEIVRLLGLSEWNLASSKEKVHYEKARRYFEELTRRLPFYGQAPLYAALSRLELVPKPVSSQEWNEVEPLLEKAYKNEKGSAWIQNVTAVTVLSEDPALSSAKKEEMLARIKESVLLRYPGRPSPYLKSNLTFLWRKFSRFEYLLAVTPEDAFSYYELVRVIEENGLWEYREPIDAKLRLLTERALENQLAIADKFLAAGQDFRRTLLEYEKAYWIDNSSLRARAGMLAAQAQLGELPGNYPAALKQILEEREEDVSRYVSLLFPVIKSAGDASLIRLFEERKSRKEAAAPRPYTTQIAPENWWGWNKDQKDLRFKLERGGRMGAKLFLKPGRVHFRLSLRSQADSKGNAAYILVRLMRGEKEKRLFSAYAAYQDWHIFEFETNTAGGERWLEIELLNGGPDGPVLEFGSMEIFYS